MGYFYESGIRSGHHGLVYRSVAEGDPDLGFQQKDGYEPFYRLRRHAELPIRRW